MALNFLINFYDKTFDIPQTTLLLQPQSKVLFLKGFGSSGKMPGRYHQKTI